VNWQGGGGFRYYRLAPSLIVNDRWGNPVINPEYNAAQLAEALAKLEGFTYAPSEVQWWQHGHSSERDFIYVTTQNLSAEQVAGTLRRSGPDQSLLVCCAAFHGVTAAKAAERWPNLTLKKIPKMVLARCEWGHDDYSLNVANLPMAQVEKVPLSLGSRRPSNGKNIKSKKSGPAHRDRAVCLGRTNNECTRPERRHRSIVSSPAAGGISLETLVRALEAAPELLGHEQDVAAILSTLKAEFPTLEDFEREFPSLCFALATGVGKTRLMGAFIAYLHLAHGINNFFVLAPNLTIYNKLIADFTRNTPKYVFKGIAEFAQQPPLIITGDNYDQTGAWFRTRRWALPTTCASTSSTSPRSTPRCAAARSRASSG
jgi:hypothetical protein